MADIRSCRVAKLRLRGRVRHASIQRELGVEVQLIEESQLRAYEGIFQVHLKGRGPHSRICWSDYCLYISFGLGICQEEQGAIVGAANVNNTQHNLLPP